MFSKQCECGKMVEITTSDAAKAMRAGRKTEITSKEAKALQKKRKTWPKKKKI